MKFALITEGISEHRVIKHIVAKYFKDYDPEINQIQPKIVNDRQETIGSWNEVLKYCEREELNDILVENDYLIIQIDTDQSQTHPFNVSHSKGGGQAKTPEELHQDVLSKLNDLIKRDIKQHYSDKIFFAICIHTIECWVLPLHYNDHHKSTTRNCLSTLNTKLRKQNIRPISITDKNSPQSIGTYETILTKWKRRKDIIDSAKHNTGFQKLIESLDTIVIPQ